MTRRFETLADLIEAAKASATPLRVAVVNAQQAVVLDTLCDAASLGLIEPHLIGDPGTIAQLASSAGYGAREWPVTAARGEAEAAAIGARLVREGKADALMKGLIHTDLFMRALLEDESGLRLPGRRVSHAFLCDVPAHPKLLAITDAAVNIAPDLTAKAQILQNAVDLCRLLGIERPKAAVLSAVETVNPAIASTLDAANLMVMARRGQIHGAVVDGPLAFDNAISAKAAAEKGIVSDVAGEADVLLVPDLVSGNILVKNLGYLARASAAGVVLGLLVPVVLTSRADPPQARLASLALAALMHHRLPKLPPRPIPAEASPHCAPQPESLCCPLPG